MAGWPRMAFLKMEIKIYNKICEKMGLTAFEIAKELGAPTEEVVDTISSLQADGAVYEGHKQYCMVTKTLQPTWFSNIFGADNVRRSRSPVDSYPPNASADQNSKIGNRTQGV